MIRRGHKLSRFRFLRCLRIIRGLCPQELLSQTDFLVTDAKEMFEVGEEGIAMENLISNLHEITFPATIELIQELRWLAKRFSLGMDEFALIDLIAERVDRQH